MVFRWLNKVHYIMDYMGVWMAFPDEENHGDFPLEASRMIWSLPRRGREWPAVQAGRPRNTAHHLSSFSAMGAHQLTNQDTPQWNTQGGPLVLLKTDAKAWSLSSTNCSSWLLLSIFIPFWYEWSRFWKKTILLTTFRKTLGWPHYLLSSDFGAGKKD